VFMLYLGVMPAVLNFSRTLRRKFDLG